MAAEATGPGTPDAIFELLDRPVPEFTESLTPEDLPRTLGQIAIYGAPPDGERPRLHLLAYEGRPYDAARAVVTELPEALELLNERRADDFYSLARQFAPIYERLSFPEQMPARMRRALQRRQWDATIEAWLELPQEALLGKSPNQAMHDGGLRVPLAGAIYVLDAFCLQNRHSIDVNELRQRLGLPTVSTIEAGPDLPLNTLSAIQLHRLPVATLDDRQLSVVLNRALLVHHGRFLQEILKEAASRTLPEIERSKIFLTLSDLARDRGDLAEALHWVEEGRKEARSRENAFESIFHWDSKELALRLEDPQAADLDPFIRRIAGYYGPKIPRFNEYLARLLESVGLSPPTILEPVGAATGSTAGGLWTPDQAGGGDEKKLWLPGT